MPDDRRGTVTSGSNERSTTRAWRLVAAKLRAVRRLRRLCSALVERIHHLEHTGVDSAAMTDLSAQVAATRDGLAACVELVNAIVRHIELDDPAAVHVSGPATAERMLALGHWLSVQPPSDLLISVIVPTRSRPSFVREAIASVQAQTHHQWELIVVDDGSVDETRTTLAAIEDDRMRVVRTAGVGSTAARSAGLELARGAAIAYLDDDNIMLPGWLAAVAWAFSCFDDVDLVYGARVMEDETAFGLESRLPRLVFRQFDRELLLEGNYVDANVIAHRADLAGAYWDSELAGVADWDLVARLTQHKAALALPVAAVLYRLGAPARMAHTPTAKASLQKLHHRLRSES
ncbi:MAG: glycosyltransferase [Solirubrobacteraceae bacterium]|jgi:hypothetical protein